MAASVFLTGRMGVEGPQGAVWEHELGGNQARLVLAVLVHERRPIDREVLAEIVWDRRPPSGWSPSLNAIVSKLRRQLDRTGLDGKATLTTGSGAYAIVLSADSWVDIEDAVRRLDRADAAGRRGDVAAALSDLTAASAVLRRPLLAGVDNLWAEGVRRHLTDLAHRCFVLLADGWIRQGDHQLAVTVAEQAIGIDPLRETGYRALIAAELARGDAGAAMRAFSRCEHVMIDELGVPVSDETRALRDRF